MLHLIWFNFSISSRSTIYFLKVWLFSEVAASYSMSETSALLWYFIPCRVFTTLVILEAEYLASVIFHSFFHCFFMG